MRSLLNTKDLSVIREAHISRRAGVVLERSFPDCLWVRVSVVGCRYPWPADCLIRVEIQRGPVYSTQYCVDSEEVMRLGY